MKQVIELIKELEVKIKHKDDILGEVYESLKNFKDSVKSWDDSDEIQRIIEMIEDL